MPRQFRNVLFIVLVVSALVLMGCSSVSEEQIQKIVDERMDEAQPKLQADLEAYMKQAQRNVDSRLADRGYQIAEITSVQLADFEHFLLERVKAEIVHIDQKTANSISSFVDSFETMENNLLVVCRLEHNTLHQVFALTDMFQTLTDYMITGDDAMLEASVTRIEAGMSNADYNANSDICFINEQGRFDFKEAPQQ